MSSPFPLASRTGDRQSSHLSLEVNRIERRTNECERNLSRLLLRVLELEDRLKEAQAAPAVPFGRPARPVQSERRAVVTVLFPRGADHA